MLSPALPRTKVGALIRTWLLIDFFGDARRAGNAHGSSLTTTIFTQSFFAFVLAALLFPETPPVPFAAATLSLSALLVAIGALGDESRPERRLADAHLLQGAPLGGFAIALARAGHAAFTVLLVTVGMALPPAVLLAFLTGNWLTAPLYVLAACLCSALAAGTLGVLARIATRWCGPVRTALLMGSVKALLLGGGLVLFALGLPRLRGTPAGMPIGSLGVDLLPPYQAARWVLAPGDDAWRLLVLLVAGAMLIGLSALFGGEADPRRQAVRAASPLRWLLARLTEPGPHRGLAEFVAITMWRSAGFRARVLPLLGMPAAMVLLTLRGAEDRHGFLLRCVLLQLPAIYLPFLIAFLPRTDQPGSGWVFEHAPELPPRVVQDATWRALVSHVLVPVHALALLLVAGAGRDPVAALPAVVFAFATAVIAAKVAVGDLEVVPFTRAGDGDASPDLGAMFANALVLGGLAIAFAQWLPPVGRWPVALATAATAALLLRRSPSRSGGAIAGGPAASAVRAGAAADGSPATAEQPPEPDAGKEDPDDLPVRRTASLGGELRAIAVLYGCLCILPLLVGALRQ